MSFFAPEQEDKLKEECGVFGIYNPDGSAAAPSIYYGLSALQHRGQEACGIAVCNTNGPKGNITWHKDMGLVSEVFHEESLDSLKGISASDTSATPRPAQAPWKMRSPSS